MLVLENRITHLMKNAREDRARVQKYEEQTSALKMKNDYWKHRFYQMSDKVESNHPQWEASEVSPAM